MNSSVNFDFEEFDRLLEEHLKRFGTGLPCYLPPKDEENIIEILRKALQTGKPYEPPTLPEGCIA